MARKLSALIKPVKVSKVDKEFYEYLAGREVEAGFEEQWDRVLKAEQIHAEEHARYDLLYQQVGKEGGSSDAPSWSAFMAQGKKSDQTLKAVLMALDGYEYAVKHRFDKVTAENSEVRLTIIDTLSDKLDELDFSINHGLLGSKVAQAIRESVSDGFEGVPILCQDCDG